MKRALLALCILAAPTPAAANGRFPATIDVHFHPGNDDVFALQATWGLLTTSDGGQTWHWSCEEAVGFAGVYDPDYAFTPTGLLLATTVSRDGLRLTRDFCTWSPAPAPLGPPNDVDPGVFIAHVEVGHDGAIYAMASTGTDSQLYVSTDDAVSFGARSNPGGGVDWWQSFAASPVPLTGGQQRLFLTGYDLGQGGAKTRYLFRSDDGGVNWTPLPLTDFAFGGDGSDLEIAAVSPTDADVVFARVYHASGTTIGDDIYRSLDGGLNWTRVFQSTDDVNAVVVRATGNAVVLAEKLLGIHVSTDGGATFGAALADPQPITCMKERPSDDLLFACGDSLEPNNMALGTGTDPSAFTSVFTFSQTDDAYACAAGTVQRDICYDTRWCSIACQFGITIRPEDGCDPCTVAPDAAPGGPDAGTGEPPKECCSTGTPESTALLAMGVALLLLKPRRRTR